MYQVPRELRSPGGVLERSPICLAPSPPASSVSCLSPLQVLFNQFKYFFNLYFLLLACSQFVPEMRLGALYTDWVPLVSQLGHPFGGGPRRLLSFRRLEQDVVFQGSGRPQPNMLGAPEVFWWRSVPPTARAHGRGAWAPPSVCLSAVQSLLVSASVSHLLTAGCWVLGWHTVVPRKAGPPTLWLVLFELFSVYDVVCVSVRG